MAMTIYDEPKARSLTVPWDGSAMNLEWKKSPYYTQTFILGNYRITYQEAALFGQWKGVGWTAYFVESGPVHWRHIPLFEDYNYLPGSFAEAERLVIEHMEKK